MSLAGNVFDRETESVRPLAAEIVTTGTEILLGEIVDTNAVWIAQQLRDVGINLYFKTTVGDNLARIQGVIELGLSRSDVIIVSGGLGPTADDVTRHAIAARGERTAHFERGPVETLKARFSRFGREMTDNNRQQALIPQGATIIENPVGTAPGFIVESGQGAVIAIPGVPREMKHLMTETVLPYLRGRNGHSGVIRRRVLRTVGIGESTIDSRLRDLMSSANPTLGLAAKTAQADVRIAARAETTADADAMLDELEATILARIGDHIYSRTLDETLEAVVVNLLSREQATVALVETNTGGTVSGRLSSAVPGVASVQATWLAGDPDLPTHLVDVLADLDQGLSFTEDQAQRCAEVARAITGATYGLAILGSGGAEEGVYGQSSGRTWIGIAGANGIDVTLCPFGGRDEYTLARIGNQALRSLWDRLK